MNLKENNGTLTAEDGKKLEILDKIIDENEGKWNDGYNWKLEGKKKRMKARKEKEKNQRNDG